MGAGPLIYVVDDELLLGQIMEAILSLEGFEVKMFTNPGAALRAFESEDIKPHILITDFVMQPFDGMELISRCRALNPALRTIVVSGNASADVFENHPFRPDAFIEKPFLPGRLLDELALLLEKGQA